MKSSTSSKVTISLFLLLLCLAQLVLCQTESEPVAPLLATTISTPILSSTRLDLSLIEPTTPSRQSDSLNTESEIDIETDKGVDRDKLTTERNDLTNNQTVSGDYVHSITDASNGNDTKTEESEEGEDPEGDAENGTEKNENSNEEEEGEEGDNEEGDYEERCTFNQFLSGLNISHYLPEDRGSLRDEYETFQDVPERIRYSPSVNYTIQRLKRLLNLANGITSRQELRSGFASFIQHNYDLFLELELDAPCMTSIISIIAAIRRSELWAIKFVDSMAKPPPGLLSGVTSFLGDFDQCLSVKSPETATEEFNGQYCLLRPILPLPDVRKYTGDSDENLIGETKLLNHLATYNLDRYVQTNPILKFIEHMKTHNGRVLNFAICLPDLCSPKQLEKSFNRLLYPIVGIPFEIHNSSCWTLAKTKDVSFHMNRFTQFAIFVLSLLTVIVSLSTLYELYSHHLSKPAILAKTCAKSSSWKTANSLVYIFSAISNTRQLFTQSSSRIAALDTLRLIIIILIGLSSAFYNTPFSSGLRKLSQSVPYELLSESKYFFIRAPSLLNDGLLVIAGALFVRSIFRHLNLPHDKFSYLLFLLRRWLRITSPLFGSILFLLILPLTGFGPLWDRMVDILLPACQSPSSLASSFLYYSNWNFVKSNHSNADAYVVCNPDTWFLSIIFQLNIAFFLVVVLVYQSPRNGLRLLVLFIVSSVVLNVSPKIFHSNTRTYYELTRQPSLWHLRRNFYLYHQNILQYVGSFCVGLLLGYAIVVNENKKHPTESNRRTEVYNWISVSTIVAVFAWVNQFFVQNSSPSEISVLFFFSFGRLAFSLAFAWIIYSCISNKSASFFAFLHSPLLQPLARLSFCIFLVQNLVQYHRMYSVKDTYVMTFKGTIENYIIDFMISSVVAYLLYLLFEGPSQRLNELFVGKGANCQVENNKTFMFGQKSAKSATSDDLYRNAICQEPPMLQHTEKGNNLIHRSKVIEERNTRTNLSNDTVADEFSDSGIITIRF